jgi:tetratricopeptide (TPR) repeat protein
MPTVGPPPQITRSRQSNSMLGVGLIASPRSSLARFARGQVLRVEHRYDGAIVEYQTIISLNRNWAHAYSYLGWCKFMTGLIEELIPVQEQAIRLSPRDFQIGLFYSRIGRAHLLQSRIDEATTCACSIEQDLFR